jgi:hypothetical protein
VTTLALVAAVAVFRVVTVLVFSAAMGALTATALSWIMAASGGPGTAWAVNVTVLAGEVAAIGLTAAVLSIRRIPSIAEIRRIAPPGAPIHPVQVIVLTALAGVALLQLPALLAWFREDRALLVEMIGAAGRDPLGLGLVPAAVLYSLPTLAAALLALFVATSIGGALARRPLALRFLTGGAVLQVGLWAIQYLVGRGIRDLGAAALRLMADAPAADTAAAVAWIQRHDAVARGMLPMLAALVIAYLVMWVAAYATRSTSIARAVAPSPVSRVLAPAELPESIQATQIPPVLRPGPSPFGERFYVLRFQPGWRIAGLMLGRSVIEYSLQTVPPTSRSEFSFSWATGILRRSSGGQEIFRLQAAERRDLLKRAYVVSDAVTGVVVGKLLPHAADWQIVDADERPVADAVQTSPSFQQTTWVVSAGGEEWCRLVAVMGATAASAEVQIEFLPPSDGKFERSLAIALAPLVEERARRSRTV